MSQIPRVYFEGDLSTGARFYLKNTEAHHLIHVLRVKRGQTVCVFTDQKKEFSAQVQAVLKDSVELQVMEIMGHHEKSWKSVLVQAIPKSQKIDWIIEKATELGVDEVYPVITRYVVKTTVRVDRLQKIAQAASQQSHRLTIPFIHPPEEWAEFLKKSKNFDLAVIACLSPMSRQSIDQALQSSSGAKTIALAIGPEGDFSSDEIKAAVKFGWIPIDLGSFILRTETAAIASLAILNHELRKKGCF
jgi:16S rRNA (uracil1498-N3)-methyltransferase